MTTPFLLQVLRSVGFGESDCADLVVSYERTIQSILEQELNIPVDILEKKDEQKIQDYILSHSENPEFKTRLQRASATISEFGYEYIATLALSLKSPEQKESLLMAFNAYQHSMLIQLLGLDKDGVNSESNRDANAASSAEQAA